MPKHPVLYQCNTRIAARQFARDLPSKTSLPVRIDSLPVRLDNLPVRLDAFPESFLDFLSDSGVSILWLLSVWQTGERSRMVSRTNPQWVPEFHHTLDSLQTDDIGGSGFAIASYQVSDQLGGPDSLAALRERLSTRGIKLMLDFVPNHMGLDHPWLESNPEYFIQGSLEQLRSEPQNYFVYEPTGQIFAHGRDPYFSGWADTVQLDYSCSELRTKMQLELLQIADQCDGVRCDMAMLLTTRVFEKTWGRRIEPFWNETIALTKQRHPSFLMMAEVYWDMEWELQEEGFDYCYDKRLYDRLRDDDKLGVRNHLEANIGYQSRLARFLENHDEARAASILPLARHIPAAVLTYLSPGLRFFHDGQFEGKRVKVSPHLIRAPEEPCDRDIQVLYRRITDLLKDPIFQEGEWELLDVQRAWHDNWSSDCLVAWVWKSPATSRIMLCIVNLAEHEAQGTIAIPEWLRDFRSRSWINHWPIDPKSDADMDKVASAQFVIPQSQWSDGEWTFFAAGSQVIVAECIG